MLQIEIIGFEGCPNVAPTVERVREIVEAANVKSHLRTVLLTTADDLAHYRFLGSPTVLINGVDIEPDARTRSDFAFGCRVYGNSGVPSQQMIEAAVREAVA